MLRTLIGTIITGLIIGYGGRAILPGAQHIGLIKTLLLGVVSAVVVGLVFSTVSWLVGIIIGSVVAAALLWLVVRQGWLGASTA